MAYYPLSQITTNLYTNGFELYNKITEESYVGYYYKLSNEKYYSGKTPQDLPSFELVVNPPSLYPSLGTFNSPPGYSISTNEGFSNFLYPNDFNYRDYPKYNPTTNSLPYYDPILPTQQDYQNRVFQRFFCKKVNEIQYIEINKNTFDQLVTKDPKIEFPLYFPFYLDWQLTGNKEQVATVNSKNTKLTSVTLKLPLLDGYLRFDYTKYYQFPNISNLYTTGGEFKTANGQNYIGFYHIHDKTGPMVGATHTKEPHGLLFPINETIISQIITQQQPQVTTQTTSSYTPPSTTTGGGGGFSGGGGGGGGGY